MSFSDLALKVFNDILVAHGFEYRGLRKSAYKQDLLFTKGDDAYITISAIVDRRGDVPPYFVVILGHGSVEPPDSTGTPSISGRSCGTSCPTRSRRFFPWMTPTSNK